MTNALPPVGLSIRHEWHQFSYDTVPKLAIAEAEYRRHVLIDREVRATRFLEQPNLDPQTVANVKFSQASDQYYVMVLSDIPRKPHWRFVAPVWPLVVIWMMPAVPWLVSGMTRRVRRKKGFCPACGYNLTGNVSGVCPECGSKVA